MLPPLLRPPASAAAPTAAPTPAAPAAAAPGCIAARSLPNTPRDAAPAAATPAAPDAVPLLWEATCVPGKALLPRCRAATAAVGVFDTVEKVMRPSSHLSVSKMRLMNSWPCRDTSSSRPDGSTQHSAHPHTCQFFALRIGGWYSVGDSSMQTG